ncbi:25749_t:CDS:2 [Dentiscutata erythropus]|uniref:25749_t:CDS:1 n=1 Tax=Dentiscutata erythropus TaxID=1348616 RepID=A0A9N9GLF1_9GLOM|nr:25749_t:CDS:2 [Dentiscutata erythropus]
MLGRFQLSSTWKCKLKGQILQYWLEKFQKESAITHQKKRSNLKEKEPKLKVIDRGQIHFEENQNIGKQEESLRVIKESEKTQATQMKEKLFIISLYLKAKLKNWSMKNVINSEEHTSRKLLKPIFIPKRNKEIARTGREKKESCLMVAEIVRKELQKTGGLDEEAGYEARKLRELKQTKRDKEREMYLFIERIFCH